MRRDGRHKIIVLICLSILLRVGAVYAVDTSKLPPAAAQTIDFGRDIQPLFQKACYSCHGPEKDEGGLRLDSKQRAFDGGDGGRAFVPGNSGDSRLIHLVGGLDLDTGRMPPEGEGTPLTSEQISMLRAWIDQGANWPDHIKGASTSADLWVLRPSSRPPLPRIAMSEWPANPIDFFILARLERDKIAPSPPASRVTLMRRLFLDLLGLPPSPEEVAEYLADSNADAYERLVDRLLSSPHFGERWGRHWLDLARYADSDGYEKDRPRPYAWRYRNWVLDAVNADLAFDKFTRDQLAGDLMPQFTLDQQVATGFHRNTLHNTEGGADPEEDRVKKTVDRTNTLGTVWLGLTVGCAQCHSHKYDPLTHREYYQLYAFFNNLDETDVDAPLEAQQAKYEQAKLVFDQQHQPYLEAVKKYETNALPAAQAKWEKTALASSSVWTTLDTFRLAVTNSTGAISLGGLPADVAQALAVESSQRNAEQAKRVNDYYRTIDPQYLKQTKAAANHARKAPKPPDTKAQAVIPRSTLRPTNIHLRGDFLNPGEPVEAMVPTWLPAIQARGGKPDRLDLANWILDNGNPLTSRVSVNRIWEKTFGRGIVATVDDFGSQSETPTHPELLDWLAVEFRESGWTTKHLLRLIVTSSAYRQSSTLRTELETVDPDNALFARQSRRRVEAEIIRDLSLAVSGLFDPRLGGPSVRPPQPAEYSKLTYANSASWTESKAGDRYRRGMYTFFQRTSPYPMLMTFDSPDSNECCVQRETSNTPLQALTLWNDPAFFELAQGLGRRIVSDIPTSADARQTTLDRANYAFALCLSRSPTGDELNEILSLFAAQFAVYGANPKLATEVTGKTRLPALASVEEVAAWTIVGRSLLNLDEFITRE